MIRHIFPRVRCCDLVGLLLAAIPVALPAIAAHARLCEAVPSEYWRNTLAFLGDPFVVLATDENPRWVKFTIMTCDPETVYYQNSNHYPFHHGFIATELEPYLGITVEQFEQLAMRADGQELMLGTVLLPSNAGWGPGMLAECGIQLIRGGAADRVAATLFEVRVIPRVGPSRAQPRGSGARSELPGPGTRPSGTLLGCQRSGR